VRPTTLLTLLAAGCWALPAAFAEGAAKAPFYEQDVGPTAKVVVLCEKLPYVQLSPQERAERLKWDPGYPARGPERYQYSFLLRDRTGRAQERLLWNHIVQDWSAVFTFTPDFSILAVSLEPHALVVVYHQDGGVCADVVLPHGAQRDADTRFNEPNLLRERGCCYPQIGSAQIVGTYENGDLAILLHNTATDFGPEVIKFSLESRWVREPGAPPPTTQPATSRP